ncbi:MAG: cysteine hydrolase family protein [Humidesulfovibrio sp.]|nr:cysteine hydrolase family protein [Humidesulfovibrio sp.]
MSDVLLLIDIQKDYFPGGRMELVGAEEAGRVAGAVLGRFRAARLPVVHIRHENVRPGSTFFLPGTAGAEIHPCVAPQSGEAVLLKHFPNSFRETALLETLRAFPATRLVVCGMMTHMCVDTTVRAAFDLGFDCRLLADACATRDLAFAGRTAAAADVQTAYLAALGAVFAKVADAAELELA